MEQQREVVDLILGGKPRTLRLEFGALSRVSRQFPDADPLRLISQLLRVEGEGDQRQIFCASLWALHVLLWAAIQTDTDQPTLDQVEGQINDFVASGRGSLADLALAVWAAWHVGGLGAAVRESPGKNAEAEAAAH